MTAKTETLYRDAPIETMDRIDESLVPDCGSGAIARMRAENGRRDRMLWYLTTVLWLALSVCALGVATFNQAPFIVLIGLVTSRDVVIILWISRDRAGITQRAIDEILKLQGAERIAREARLREAVAVWNADAASYGYLMGWIGNRPSPREAARIRHAAQQLLERRRFLDAEIASLRDGPHAVS